MKPVFCFIDDAEFELQNFRRFAAAAFDKVDFVYALTFAEAQRALQGRIPLCFLLDLYGTDPQVSAPRVPGRDELSATLGPVPTLDTIYQGLQGEGTELGNLFLRRLYAQVDGWQRTFLHAAGLLGQGLGYGLANLESVRAAYPWAAAVGYSRKSLYADAVRACLAEMDGLLQKPPGSGEDEIARATRSAAPALAKTAYRAVDRRLTQQVMPLALRLAQEKARPELVDALVDCVGRLGVAELGHSTRAPQESMAAISKTLSAPSALTKPEADLLRALSEWLEHR